MSKVKYYDYKKGAPISSDIHGCLMSDWATRRDECPFAIHPSGFKVFLSPEELDISDEYRKSDPYAVQENTEGNFHRRRIECTLDMVRQTVSSVPGTLKFLDVGCGQGHITARIKEEFPNLEVSAFDYSVSAIDYAWNKYKGVDFCVANAYSPPYVERYFDLVVCNNLWEHVPDPLRLLQEISRILKQGGHVVISTPSRYRLNNLLRVLRGKPVALMSPHHVTEYTVGQIFEQLRYCGFEVVRYSSRSLTDERLLLKMVKSILNLYFMVIRSKHSAIKLESTVFFLARHLR